MLNQAWTSESLHVDVHDYVSMMAGLAVTHV